MPKGVYKRKKKNDEEDDDYQLSLSQSVSYSKADDDYYEENWLFEPVFFKRWQLIVYSIIVLCLVYSQEIYNFVKRIHIVIN
jgi:hypothetical protein